MPTGGSPYRDGMGTRELHMRLMAAYAGPAVRAVLVEVVDWLGERCRVTDDAAVVRRAQAVIDRLLNVS